MRKQNPVRYNHIFELLLKPRAPSYTITVPVIAKSYQADCEHQAVSAAQERQVQPGRTRRLRVRTARC